MADCGVYVEVNEQLFAESDLDLGAYNCNVNESGVSSVKHVSENVLVSKRLLELG
jgi:hypothetical protein